MTLEEALKKVQALETDLTTERKKVSDQNSYITKLETQVNQGGQQNQGQGQGTDPVLQAYIEKKMREDVLAQSLVLIRADISNEEYKAVEEDFLKFLEKNMKKTNTTVDYISDAFALVWGRAHRNKDHAIHTVKAATPSGTTPQPGTTNPFKNPIPTVSSQPPGITDTDGGGTPPPDGGQKVSSTKDAFKSLKTRMGNIGGNRFS